MIQSPHSEWVGSHNDRAMWDQTEPALNVIWSRFVSLENQLSHAEHCGPVLVKIWPVCIRLTKHRPCSGQFPSGRSHIVRALVSLHQTDQELAMLWSVFVGLTDVYNVDLADHRMINALSTQGIWSAAGHAPTA
jgi:hypothetical protein